MNKMREIMNETEKTPVHYHLPGLIEFYELYKVFLPLYRKHREYFYDWCDIASIYGAPVDYLKKQYPNLYLVSTTTKVLTHFDDFKSELNRPEFKYVVPDFRLNKALNQLSGLPQLQKDKVEFIVYYMTKPEHQLEVREAIYLDSMLDLF